ncbi:MAG: VCBS repeat-containing protein [Deltaproteobacteria bacterium]|nr:VCBS repeat-containing protein [Deltaproteobacteria bacterium]
MGPVPTGGWSNRVELCDVDDDGDLDALVANGAAYSAADLPQRPFLWRNVGDHFVDDELPVAPGWWRVVKCADVDGDGDSDVFFGGTFQSPSVLLLQSRRELHDVSERLPAELSSCGDAEWADVDGDGDLDLAMADWGEGDPLVERGVPRLWMQGTGGVFVDESAERLPGVGAGFSWDLEAVDVDDDLDLDLLVSCKACVDGGLLLQNDGDGVFVDQSGSLPGVGNNYEFEPLDVDGDGDLDLFTVNDGPALGERLLVNEGGVFTEDANAFAPAAVSSDDDNAALVLDVDGDGDPDVLVVSISGDDRVLVNEGGVFVESIVATDGRLTPGSLGAALGDLDGDGKLDLVLGQGEAAFDDAVFLGDDITLDATRPFIGAVRFDVDHQRIVVRAHDHLTPVRDFDVEVTAHFAGAGGPLRSVPLRRAGEQQWQASVGGQDTVVVVCARDRSGIESCADPLGLPAVVHDDAGLVLGGGGCEGAAASACLLPVIVFCRRRRLSRMCS